MASQIRKKPAKSLINRRVGEAFEDAIKKANDRYLMDEKARIVKTHAEVKMIRDKEDNKKIKTAFHVDKAPPDFVGMLYGGRHIEFETKTCEDYKTGFKLVNIAKHQMDQLRQVHSLGGLAFVLVHFQLLGETYVLTLEAIDIFKRERAETGLSASVIDYEWFRTRTERAAFGGGVTFDFLGALHRMGEIK
jgi:recombination protein U